MKKLALMAMVVLAGLSCGTTVSRFQDSAGHIIRIIDVGRATHHPDGHYYIVDKGHRRILKFDGLQRLKWEVGPQIAPHLEFTDTLDVAVDPGGTLYVLDSVNQTLTLISATGKIQSVVHLKDCRVPVPTPLAIACGQDNTVWIADWLNNTLVQLDSQGRYVSHFRLNRPDQHVYVHVPGTLKTDANTLYVLDQMESRVVAYSQEGRVLRQYAFPGFRSMKEFAVAPHGVLYGLNGPKSEIQLVSDQNTLKKWTDTDPKTFFLPAALVKASAQGVYVMGLTIPKTRPRLEDQMIEDSKNFLRHLNRTPIAVRFVEMG
jgi:hypothetical protein